MFTVGKLHISLILFPCVLMYPNHETLSPKFLRLNIRFTFRTDQNPCFLTTKWQNLKEFECIQLLINRVKPGWWDLATHNITYYYFLIFLNILLTF